MSIHYQCKLYVCMHYHSIIFEKILTLSMEGFQSQISNYFTCRMVDLTYCRKCLNI